MSVLSNSLSEQFIDVYENRLMNECNDKSANQNLEFIGQACLHP